MFYSLSDLMQLIYSEQGEAVHLHEGESPVVEVKRTLVRLEGPPLKPGEAEQLLGGIASLDNLSELRVNGLCCFDLHFREVAAFQVMAFRENDHVRLELRRLE